MAQLAVCKKTGTILYLEDVMIVSHSVFEDEKDYSDSEICDLAEYHGITIRQLVETKIDLALTRVQSALRKRMEKCIRKVAIEEIEKGIMEDID